MILATFPLAAAIDFGYFFPPAAAEAFAAAAAGPRIGKHHGSEGRRSPKIEPQKCLTKLLKPIENDDFGYFFLLLLLWIWSLAMFSSCCCRGFCCCWCCWSLDGKAPCQWRTEKPQNCTPKMLNVTSETHRKLWFWLLFPLAAAMDFGSFFLLPLQRLLLLLLVPGWENTMAVKDGEAPKLHPENA